MDFLQTYPQIAEYVEDFKYFAATDFMGRIEFIHERPFLEMALLGLAGYAGWLLYKEVTKPPQNPYSHGKRRWATIADARKLGLIVKKPSGKRILLGRIGDEWLEADIHATVISKNGGGKGRGVVVPNLLAYTGSVICYDTKGENFAKTHRYRKEIGQEVYAIDPYNELLSDEENSHFNPLDYIDVNDESGSKEANLIAETLFPKTPGEHVFFSEGARNLIAATCMYVKVKCPPEEQNMGKVREFLTKSAKEKTDFMFDMQKCEEFQGAIKRAANFVLEMAGTPENPIKIDENGKKIEEKQLDKPNETVLDLYGTVNVSMKFLDDPKVCRVLSRSDMKMHMLKYLRTTIYFIVSAADYEVSTQLTKFFYTYALKKNVTPKKPLEAEAIGLEVMKEPLLFLMDEFAQMKNFAIIKDLISLVRGYKIRFLTILQGKSQLDEHYKEGGAEFMTNSTKMFMGADDLATANEISGLCGETTIRTESIDGLTRRKTYGWQKEWLITPGDVLSSSPLEPFVFFGEMHPLRIKQIIYYNDPYFKGKYDEYNVG